MNLFVINRHQGDDVAETAGNDEQSKLDKVLMKIERNKKIRSQRKEKKQEAITKTTIKRQIKRDKKANFIPVPENEKLTEEFIEDDGKQPESEIAVEAKEPVKKQNQEPSVEGFTVLGADNFDKKTKVKRVLPKWLANPAVISMNLQQLETKVSSIKLLDKDLRKKIKSAGITYFFPVQAQVIPYLLESNKHSDIVFPRDICVSAPTGSGKTLAFALPVIQALKRHTIRKIRALVILPTQDLATQLFKTFKYYAEDTKIDVCLITGNNSFAVEQKQLITKNDGFGFISKADILICTAGRLVDHLKSTEGFSLHDLEFLVIDEADRVLDNVQNDWLYHLDKHIHQQEESTSQIGGKMLNLFTLRNKRPPQKLLFSATLSQDPEKLQKLSLFQPKLFTSVVENSDDEDEVTKPTTDNFIGKFTTPKELTEKYIVCSMDLKPLVLYKFIKQEKLTKTIIFTNSQSNVHRLAILLKSLFKDELVVQEISSHLQIKNRKDLIGKFSSSKIDILISTDALARGIDLPGVKCVISYSSPKHLKTYIHRAGRTARAGEYGLAITLLHNTQLGHFKTLLQQADKNNVTQVNVPEEDLEQLGEEYKQALEELKNIVAREEVDDLKKIKAAKSNSFKSHNKFKRKRNNSSGSI